MGGKRKIRRELPSYTQSSKDSPPSRNQLFGCQMKPKRVRDAKNHYYFLGGPNSDSDEGRRRDQGYWDAHWSVKPIRPA